VLTYNDLSPIDPGFWIYLTHQVVKETFAAISSVRDVAGAIGGEVKVF
jgi:hypothetical protein